MRKRWTAAGMLVAEQQFRRIIGYRDLAKLVIAIERHADRVKLAEAKSVAHADTLEGATVQLSIRGDRRRSSTTIRTSSAAELRITAALPTGA